MGFKDCRAYAKLKSSSNKISDFSFELILEIGKRATNLNFIIFCFTVFDHRTKAHKTPLWELKTDHNFGVYGNLFLGNEGQPAFANFNAVTIAVFTPMKNAHSSVKSSSRELTPKLMLNWLNGWGCAHAALSAK
jgi:hypothetical protein